MSASLEQLLAAPPYGLLQEAKRALLTERTRELIAPPLRPLRDVPELVDRLFGGERALAFERLEDAPFLPVSLFKTRELEASSRRTWSRCSPRAGRPARP